MLLLDLAHEVGHAVALQGPIGVRQASHRAVINYSEMLLLDLAGRSATTDGTIQPALAVLPNHVYAQALIAIQLDASAMAAMERALWRSWLEGLSMYLEMLADPTDDSDQISMVHAAVRSLIDFDIPRQRNETDDEYRERYAAEANGQFEGFYGAALKARSRLQHLAYFDDLDGARRTASDLYVLGYLQVRAVVAAWEATLSRRIAPAVATRLLFTATLAGAFKFYDNLGATGSMSRVKLRQSYRSWLRTIAEVPADRLTEYFAPTGPDQPGIEFIWEEVLRRRDADIAGADRIDKARRDALERDMLRLAHIDTSSGDEASARHAELLGLLFNSYLQDNSLLPIGTYAAKLLFMTTPGRIGLSVRTYSGHAAPATPNPANPTQHEPRYNFRFWGLPGGEEESNELRQACGRARTARLSATRIIDLARRPDLPFCLAGMSYLCGFLGSALAVVVPWGTSRDVARDHPAFAEVLRDRVMPRFGISDEASTTARLGFLARRALVLDPDNARAASMETVDVEDFALEIAKAGVADAVGVSVDAFASIYDDSMGAPACRRAMARVLHATGRGIPAGDEPDLVGRRFADLVLDRHAFSGVTPFGGKR